MTWAANGAFPGQTEFSGGGTVPLNNTAIGDLVLMVAISVDSTFNWVTGVSGGGCTWTQVGTTFHGTVNGEIATVWQGTVTATGAQTATVTVTGGGPTIAIVTQEFSSSVGSWVVDQVQFLDSAGTSTWPTLTPSGTGELGFGFAIDSGIAVAGSTPGWTYKVTSHDDGAAWDTSVSAPSAPAWGDSGQVFGAMVLMKESGGTSHTATASLTVTPAFAASRLASRFRTATLHVVPAFTAQRMAAHVRSALLQVNPVLTAHGAVSFPGAPAVLFSLGPMSLEWTSGPVTTEWTTGPMSF